ncbi:MAG: hypothetical protein V4589_13005 [Bacteroidota bacterium]
MFTKKKIFIYSITLTVTLLFVSFCILVLLKNKNFEKEYAFDIGFPPKNFYKDYFGCSFEKILSFRNFTTYQLKNDKFDDKLFKDIQLATRNLIKNNDSENGIHVKFNKKTKYGDVIKVLDICRIEKVPTYILKDYDVWILTGSNSELEKQCPFKLKKP